MELTDYAIEFVKARNAITKTLKEHSVQGNEITFVHKHKLHHFLISPQLISPKSRDHYTIVCLNTKQNIEFLISHWDAFLKPHLSVLFVNPDAHAHWQITPQVHSLIADEENLAAGIRSLASDVPLM